VSYADFSVRVVCQHGRAIVFVEGEADLVAVERFGDALRAAQEGAPDVIVDLNQVTFMDSTCLKALVRARRQTAEGGCLKAVGARPPVRRVFEMTGLADLLLDQERGLTWRQVVAVGGAWRQWLTDERTAGDEPVGEILEVGAWAGYDPEDAHYVLEMDGRTELYRSLTDAIRAAECPDPPRPIFQPCSRVKPAFPGP